MSPQISSFTVTPNYEILFFGCDTFEVVNILDFREGKVNLNTVKTDVEQFQPGGESNGSERLEILF